MTTDRLPIVGQTAPCFQLECVEGTQLAPVSVRLSDFVGRWLILIFYPRDFSFVCPTELTAFSAHMADFRQRKCDLLGISVDSIDSHLEWLTKSPDEGGLGRLQFPLASDTDGLLSRMYGVWVADKKVATRGLFIIDRDGLLQYAVVHNLNVGRSSDEVLRVLDGLQDGGLCPSNWTSADGTIDPEDALHAGRVLGHYRIKELLGSGTFGTVFAAWDLRLERMVALKVLKRNVIESREFLLREARTAARLNHTNVCTIYAVEEEDGLPVIAMEHIDGRPLHHWIQRGISIRDAVSFAYQIAQGLAEAHRHNVVHGDFKPANIIVDQHGNAKILDFGLARSLRMVVGNAGKYASPDDIRKMPDGPEFTSEDTVEFAESIWIGSYGQSIASGNVRGTPAYMSPEQAAGRRTTPASDVFSFGLTLYEMLTGCRALAVGSFDDLLSQLSDHQLGGELSAKVDEPFRDVLSAALELDEIQRPVMHKIVEDLDRLVQQNFS
jgi:alkyl hydroperoxide reductase subunit AhpC/predicted Ser/Thr protein kinase